MTDANLRLHYAPRTRSFTALWLLEELGLPYELESFTLQSGHNLSEEFRALNPMRKVPVVVHDGVPVSELGAIAIYLADRFPEAGLAPAIDDVHRPVFLRWCFFSSAIIEPALDQKIFKWDAPPARSVAWGSFERMHETLLSGLEPGPWLLAERFTAADVLVGSSARFALMFGGLEKQGPIADYVARLSEREAFARAQAIEAREAERLLDNEGAKS